MSTENKRTDASPAKGESVRWCPSGESREVQNESESAKRSSSMVRQSSDGSHPWDGRSTSKTPAQRMTILQANASTAARKAEASSGLRSGQLKSGRVEPAAEECHGDSMGLDGPNQSTVCPQRGIAGARWSGVFRARTHRGAAGCSHCFIASSQTYGPTRATPDHRMMSEPAAPDLAQPPRTKRGSLMVRLVIGAAVVVAVVWFLRSRHQERTPSGGSTAATAPGSGAPRSGSREEGAEGRVVTVQVATADRKD